MRGSVSVSLRVPESDHHTENLQFLKVLEYFTIRMYCISYCTGQRSPHKIFFNRLPGPPRRLDLTQMVLMTTESASSESGGRQAGAGGSAKTRACIRGIPRSARGRGRVARPDATPTGCRARARDRKIYPGSLSKFRKQSTRKSGKYIRCRIQFWAECICQNFDSGHAVRTQNIF